jgi:hypothetical protein
MALRSPLAKRKASSVSVCGKLLQSGQSITVSESAVGPRERKLADKGRIRIRSSNQKGKVQILCTMK